MPTTDDKALRDDQGHLSLWTIGIGGVAFATMFFNPASLLGVLAVIPGVRAIRAQRLVAGWQSSEWCLGSWQRLACCHGLPEAASDVSPDDV